jgi:hypothetical protein
LPLVAALIAALNRHQALRCSGTELLQILTQFKPQHATTAAGWPNSSWALSRILRRMAGQLRAIGINFTTGFEHTRRIISITRPGLEKPNL